MEGFWIHIRLKLWEQNNEVQDMPFSKHWQATSPHSWAHPPKKKETKKERTKDLEIFKGIKFRV